MKTNRRWIVLLGLTLLCSHVPSKATLPASPGTVQSSGGLQYVYIGGYYGIYEFRVMPNGSLQPLRDRPAEGGSIRSGFSLDALLVDPQARTVYGLSQNDKIYSYTIGRTGKLSLKSVAPFAVTAKEQQVVIDPQRHFLYALDSDNGLIIYNATNSKRIVRTQTVKDAGFQSLLLNQKPNSLLVFKEHSDPVGRVTSSVLIRYALGRRGRLGLTQPTRHFIGSLSSASAIAERLLIQGSGETLVVSQMQSDGSLLPLSRHPLPSTFAANLPVRIVYRRAGAFVYLGTYASIDDPHQTPSPSPLLVYCLSGGHLHYLGETGKPVPNPRPYLDKTGRFLYIVSEEGTVDAYKIVANGQLAPVGSRLKVAVPTGMVFFSRR